MSEAFRHQMNPQCRFSEMHIGEKFRFPGSDIIHTKTASGYKSPGSKLRWKTGRMVAVIPITKGKAK